MHTRSRILKEQLCDATAPESSREPAQEVALVTTTTHTVQQNNLPASFRSVSSGEGCVGLHALYAVLALPVELANQPRVVLCAACDPGLNFLHSQNEDEDYQVTNSAGRSVVMGTKHDAMW